MGFLFGKNSATVFELSVIAVGKKNFRALVKFVYLFYLFVEPLVVDAHSEQVGYLFATIFYNLAVFFVLYEQLEEFRPALFVEVGGHNLFDASRYEQRFRFGGFYVVYAYLFGIFSVSLFVSFGYRLAVLYRFGIGFRHPFRVVCRAGVDEKLNDVFIVNQRVGYYIQRL